MKKKGTLNLHFAPTWGSEDFIQMKVVKRPRAGVDAAVSAKEQCFSLRMRYRSGDLFLSRQGQSPAKRLLKNLQFRFCARLSRNQHTTTSAVL